MYPIAACQHFAAPRPNYPDPPPPPTPEYLMPPHPRRILIGCLTQFITTHKKDFSMKAMQNHDRSTFTLAVNANSKPWKVALANNSCPPVSKMLGLGKSVQYSPPPSPTSTHAWLDTLCQLRQLCFLQLVGDSEPVKVDEASLTGESMAVNKRTGDCVLSGACCDRAGGVGRGGHRRGGQHLLREDHHPAGAPGGEGPPAEGEKLPCHKSAIWDKSLMRNFPDETILCFNSILLCCRSLHCHDDGQDHPPPPSIRSFCTSAPTLPPEA